MTKETVRPCKSKNPATCPYHGNLAKADRAFENRDLQAYAQYKELAFSAKRLSEEELLREEYTWSERRSAKKARRAQEIQAPLDTSDIQVISQQANSTASFLDNI